MFKKILVGYDGSDSARAALQKAALLAKESDGELTAIWVHEPLPHLSDLPGEFEEEMEATGHSVRFRERETEVQAIGTQYAISIRSELRSGHPAKAIIDAAEEGHYDLIVVGHRDHSGLWGRLLGDTADRISDHAHCSVLIVKN
jgi:nucleotide-binding universal stress UspA family protein